MWMSKYGCLMWDSIHITPWHNLPTSQFANKSSIYSGSNFLIDKNLQKTKNFIRFIIKMNRSATLSEPFVVNVSPMEKWCSWSAKNTTWKKLCKKQLRKINTSSRKSRALACFFTLKCQSSKRIVSTNCLCTSANWFIHSWQDRIT